MRRIAGFLFAILLGSNSFGQSIHGRDGITLPPPPAVESNPVVDNYFGTKVTDNYRWLEDAKSSETHAFIDEENAYTTRYLKQNHIRNQIQDDLDPLEHTSRWSIPIQRAGNYYFMKRLAGEEQASIYVRHGWTGAAPKGAPSAPKDERLIDPAALSRDPNTSVRLADVSRDGIAHRLPGPPGRRRRGHRPHLQHREKEAARRRTPCRDLLLHHLHARRQRPLLRAHRPQRHSALPAHYRHASRRRQAHLRPRVSRRTAWPHRPLPRRESPTTPTISSSRSSAACRPNASTSCFRDLTKPGSPFEVLVWGTRFALLRHLRPRTPGTSEPTTSRPMAASSRRSRHHARGMEDHRARGQRRHRGFLHRRRKDLRQAAQGREVGNQHLHSRRQARRHHRLSTASAPPRRRRPNHRPLRLLQLRVVHPAAHHLPARYRSPANAKSSPSPKSPSTPANTNSSRSSSNQKTAPRSPCSSPAKRA